MNMGPRGASAVAHETYYFTSLYLLASINIISGEMAIGSGYSSAVVNPEVSAQISVLATSVNDTIRRCNNGRTLITAYVQAVVKLLRSGKGAAPPAKTGREPIGIGFHW